MRLLPGQDLPRSAALHLRAEGFEADPAGDVDLATALDRTILVPAREHGEIVDTPDAGFHAQPAFPGDPGTSVIRLHFQALNAKGLADLLVQAPDRGLPTPAFCPRCCRLEVGVYFLFPGGVWNLRI